MILKFKKLVENAKLPIRANPGDLGFDLFTLDTVVIYPGQTILVKTGIAAGFPEGWAGFVKARSSQGKAGVDIFGGVIDNGYTGEIGVLVHNSTQVETSNYEIKNLSDYAVVYKAGEKIGQLVLVPVFAGEVIETTELKLTERGDKGFGSSGR